MGGYLSYICITFRQTLPEAHKQEIFSGFLLFFCPKTGTGGLAKCHAHTMI